MAEAPRGLYIVDRSAGDSDELGDLLHAVVILSFVARDEFIDMPSGIDMGRVWAQPGAWRDRGAIRFHERWSLALLTSGIQVPHIELCKVGAVLPFDIPESGGSGARSPIGDLFRWLRDHPDQESVFNKMRADLFALARVPPGSKILGEVIGRLTGHLGRAGKQKKI